MKKSLLFLFVSFICFNVYSVTSTLNDSSLIAYRTAKSFYNSQDYGKALKNAEDAILFRKQKAENEIKLLSNALSPRRVQMAGDEIDEILKVLSSRGEKEAINIITSYLSKKGDAFFNNSMKNLIDYIDDTKEYPEAQKLIGDIYKLEGEYEFAEEYYLMALENQHVLDIPDEKYDILYTLADISKFQLKYDEMEVRLLNILTEDPFYKDKALFSAMIGTIKSEKAGSVEKYFMLYRAGSYYCLNAYYSLSEYYESIGDKEKALDFSALCVITGFSKIDSLMKSRNAEYNADSLSVFFDEVMLNPDIIEWGIKNNFWKDFNKLAEITSKQGYKVFARELLQILAKKSPQEYWQKDAVLQLGTLN